MKTQHLRKFYSKEILAWLVLTCAALLLGATLSFAQEPANKKMEGKIHIKIEKEENGNKVKVDTTFDVKDYEKMQEYLGDLDEELSLPPLPPGSPIPPNSKMKRSFHSFSFDEKDKEKFREEMRKLKHEMKDLAEEFKELRIEMFSDSFPDPSHFRMEMGDGEDGFFNFNWNDDHKMIGRGNCIKIISDSVDGEDRVIILGEGSGDSHSVERKTGENGEQIIIIKKSMKKPESEGKEGSGKKEKSKKSSSKLEPLRLDYYPNPGNGRFTLSFQLEKKGHTRIAIMDPSGKEIYGETINDFDGEYSKQIDISKSGKGTYLLKISQNGKSLSKKVVVE